MIYKKMTNCPNCGAPIIHSYNYNCLYCNTFLRVADDIEYVENKELSHIEVKVEKMFIEPAILITITGYLSQSFSRCYEYNGENNGFSYLSDYFKPKKIGFNIKIPFAELRGIHDYNVFKLYDRIDQSIPPEFKGYKGIIYRGIFPKLENILK